MTSSSAPLAARDLLEQVAEAARSKEVIAFTIPTLEGEAMFVNLPTGDAGPSHGWIGYWDSIEDQGAGRHPSVVIATAPAGGRAEVERQIRSAHGLPYVRVREADGVAVVVASSSAEIVDSPLQRLVDAEPLIARWFELATHGLPD